MRVTAVRVAWMSPQLRFLHSLHPADGCTILRCRLPGQVRKIDLELFQPAAVPHDLVAQRFSTALM